MVLTFSQQRMALNRRHWKTSARGETRDMKIGFIGLGIMGRPMAGHVIRGGHSLHIYSRGTPPLELIEAGAIACGSPREVAERSDAVITMVPDTPDVEAVVFGPGGIAEGFSP